MNDNSETTPSPMESAPDINQDILNQFRSIGRFLHHHSDGRGGQRRVLTILSEKGTMPQNELMQILDVKPGSISELLSKLEAKGLLERTRDGEDKRAVMLSITDAGKQAVEQMRSEYDSTHADLLSELSDEEKEFLQKTLAKLRSNWELSRGFGSHEHHGQHGMHARCGRHCHSEGGHGHKHQHQHP